MHWSSNIPRQSENIFPKIPNLNVYPDAVQIWGLCNLYNLCNLWVFSSDAVETRVSGHCSEERLCLLRWLNLRLFCHMKAGSSDLLVQTSHVNVSLPPVVYLCKYVYHWRLVLACVYVLVPFVLFLASMPSFCSGCLPQQDVVWNGRRRNFKWKSGAGCREQPPAWLPSNNSLWGHENYASESVNGKVEEGKTWNVCWYFSFKK